jgi:hypothetical protein
MAAYVYNNVFLQLTDTLEFTAEPEYDPSGTDMLWTKYTIRVRGIVAEGNSRFPGVSDTTKQSGVTLNRIKVALETPRRPIRYTIGDTNLINITMGGQPENQDAQLGPHPLPATVTETVTTLALLPAEQCAETIEQALEQIIEEDQQKVDEEEVEKADDKEDEKVEDQVEGPAANVSVEGEDLPDQPDQAVAVRQVAIVQVQLRLLAEDQVLDPLRAEGAGATTQAVHFVALREQQLREVGTVLTRDTRDQGTPLHR